MKKIFFVIVLILHTNIFAEQKQNESRELLKVNCIGIFWAIKFYKNFIFQKTVFYKKWGLMYLAALVTVLLMFLKFT